MTEFLAYGAAFAATYLGTAVFRRWSLGRGVVDVPNERSSHLSPTPRGGGIVFVSIALVGYVVLAVSTQTLPWSYIIGALLVAGISWIDDLWSISFAWRLIVHFIAAGILLADSAFSAGEGIWGGIASILAVFWIAWMINAYNFMDGIDGIAGVQAIVAATAWSALAFINDQPAVSFYAGILAAAILGFLVHNWQPAKIFMGDVGSAFLGFTLASFPFLGSDRDHHDAGVFVAAGVIFVWLFVFDTVVTLVRRLVRREKVWQAHRSHLYQRMVIGGMQHATVTSIYGAFAAALSIVYIIASQRSMSVTSVWTIAVIATLAVLSAALIFLSRRNTARPA